MKRLYIDFLDLVGWCLCEAYFQLAVLYDWLWPGVEEIWPWGWLYSSGCFVYGYAYNLELKWFPKV